MFSGKRGSLRKALYRQRDRPNSGGSVDIPAICEPVAEEGRSENAPQATQSDDKVRYRGGGAKDGGMSPESRHHRVRSALASVSLGSKAPKCPSPLTVETNGCTCPGHISAEVASGAKAEKCPVHSAPNHLRSNSTSPQGCYQAVRGHSNSAYALNAPLLIPLHGTPSSGSSSSMRSRLSSSIYLAARLSHHPTVVDFEDWNTSDHKSQEQVFALFFKAHKCIDIVPNSSKLVVFDTELPVSKAFFALVYNGVRAAPLWDSKKQEFVGMLTITDFIQILHRYYTSNRMDEGIRELEQHKISTWREVFEADGHVKPVVTIGPSESLYRAVQILCESKIHRLPVLEPLTGDICYILTHKRLMKFLYLYINDLPRPSFMDKTPKELGIGSWGDICTVSKDTPLIEAMKIFLQKRVSALPVVDSDGRVVDIYAKFDAINLAADKSYNNLDVSVYEALNHRSDWFEGVRKCSVNDSLMCVIDTIVKAEVHRLIVTDDEQRVVGIISLSDILKHLVLEPPKLEEDSPAGPVIMDVTDGDSARNSSASFDALDKNDELTMDGGS